MAHQLGPAALLALGSELFDEGHAHLTHLETKPPTRKSSSHIWRSEHRHHISSRKLERNGGRWIGFVRSSASSPRLPFSPAGPAFANRATCCLKDAIGSPPLVSEFLTVPIPNCKPLPDPIKRSSRHSVRCLKRTFEPGVAKRSSYPHGVQDVARRALVCEKGLLRLGSPKPADERQRK